VTLKTKAASKEVAVATSVAEDMSGLVVPTCFGMFQKFNYTTRKMTTTIMVQKILHNGVKEQDVEFEWVMPHLLKIHVALPDWFQMAEQMAQFCLDNEGNMLYPPERSLTMDTSMRTQAFTWLKIMDAFGMQEYLLLRKTCSLIFLSLLSWTSKFQPKEQQ
jgi:hypothetical protein